MLELNKLYNLDCMDGMREFPDKFFELAIVDPVYGDVTGGGYTTSKFDKQSHQIGTGRAKQLAYHRGIWKQPKTPPEYFKELFRVSKNQIVFGGNYFSAEIAKDSQCWIIWDKQHPVERTFADCELAWTSFNSASRIFRYMWDGMLQGNMRDKEAKIHPTQKPIALYKWLLTKYAKEGDKILDTHVGSASSLIACHDLHFDFVGFEIDKLYYDAAIERMQEDFSQLRLF